MSIHLVGGGRSGEHLVQIYGPFLAEAVQRARQDRRVQPRIGVVQLLEKDEDQGTERYEWFAETLASLGPCEPVALMVNEGETLAADQLRGLDGLLVSGGLTPAYLTAVSPVMDEIRALVGAGLPYLGFSAGAAIAARRAIIGGWKVGNQIVCHEDNGEELDELTVVDGLGLVDFSVDVHAVEWGNVTRLLMAVESGAVDEGVALDESTVLIMDGTSPQVSGAGQAWWAAKADRGVTMRVQPAAPVIS